MEEIMPKRIGGLFDKNGKTHQAGSIWDKEKISPTLDTCGGGYREPLIMEENRFYKQAFETIKENDCEVGDTVDAFNKKVNDSGVSPTVTTRPEGFKTAILVVDEPIIYDDFNGRIKADQSAVGCQTTNCGNDAPRNGVKIIEGVKDNEGIRKVLCILWQKIGEKAFCEWAIRGLWCILSSEVLRCNVYGESKIKDWLRNAEIQRFSPYGSTYQRNDITDKQMRDLWEKWEIRCSSYRRELSEQQYREFESFVQKLSYETTSQKVFVQSMWETCGRWNGILQQALFEIQEIWKPIDDKKMQWNFRVRKLTERECGKLQGVKPRDCKKIATHLSKSAQYHCFGDSITTTVLMAIFGQMLDIDWQQKVNETVKEIIK